MKLARVQGETDNMVSATASSSIMNQVQVSPQRVGGTKNGSVIRKLKIRSPIVLIPDLRDVLLKRVRLPIGQRQGRIRRARVPLRKVSPVPMSPKEKRETSVSVLPSRRNADRACKTGSPDTPPGADDEITQGTESDRDSLSSRSSSRYARARTFRGRRGKKATRDASIESIHEAGFCNYCSKKFNVADFALEHELTCAENPIVIIQRSSDVRDNEGAKANFLQSLQLKPVHGDDEQAKSVDVKQVARAGPSDSKRQRLERSQVLKQFRSYPLPFSSIRGQKLIADSGVLLHNHDEGTSKEHDQDCYKVKTRGRTHWPTTKSKKGKNKDESYAHQASFSKQQRIERNSEIVLGLSHKSWKNLNKCRPVVVVAKRLRPIEIVRVLSRSRVPPQLENILGERLQVKIEDLTTQPWFLKRFPFFAGNK